MRGFSFGSYRVTRVRVSGRLQQAIIEGNNKGWALVSCDISMEDKETVIDHTNCEWINKILE